MDQEQPIRIVIVDDQAVVRSGLEAMTLVNDDLELVGQAGSGEAAVEMCRQLQPDVALIDLIMPGMDGVSAIRGIRAASPRTQIIALSFSLPEDQLVQQALQAGAAEYLMKNIWADELANAIRKAVRKD